MMRKRLFILCFLLPFGLLKGQPIDGPVARYTFNNNNGKDDIGKNDATLYNVTPTRDRFGNEGFAYYLQGHFESFISLGTSDVLKPKHGSISVWVKVHSIIYNGMGVPSNPIIYTRAHDDDDFNEAYVIGYSFDLDHISGATSRCQLSQAYVHPDKTTSLREWHHAVLTYDDSYLHFYLDGKLEGKMTKDFQSIFLKDAPVLVGQCMDNKNQRFLFGSVDDIAIYDRVLSQAEVTELYNAPNPNRFRRILNWALIMLWICAFIAGVIWLIRLYVQRAIRKEKEKDKLRNQWYEQENKVLKAQMNPHFIFNSLNTIQQFIIVNENAKAQLYLSKFSKLIRKLLESNTRDRISLKEEIDLCERYLEIESMRFNNIFSYDIVVRDNIDVSGIHIPHFLIQVFIENAIWHGLLPKDGNKQINITFKRIDEKTLSCTIDDNGVGRRKNKPVEILDEKRSLAIDFVQQRLGLYSKIRETEYGVNIIDKFSDTGQSEGTRAVLTIPILSN